LDWKVLLKIADLILNRAASARCIRQSAPLPQNPGAYNFVGCRAERSSCFGGVL